MAAALAAAAALCQPCVLPGTSAQHIPRASKVRAPRDERVRRVLESLEPGNTLRFALERGDRGSGPRRGWMDGMRRYGVRQASFRIRFHWGERAKRLEITDVKYLRRYYRFDTAIEDEFVTAQIRAAGLERDLRDEVLRRAEAELVGRESAAKQGQACGTLYLNLLDDEVLPILDDPPDYDDDCVGDGSNALSGEPRRPKGVFAGSNSGVILTRRVN